MKKKHLKKKKKIAVKKKAVRKKANAPLPKKKTALKRKKVPLKKKSTVPKKSKVSAKKKKVILKKIKISSKKKILSPKKKKITGKINKKPGIKTVKINEPEMHIFQPPVSESSIKDEIEKYHSLPDFQFLKDLKYEIPDSYNFHKLGLLIVDPYWIYVYWEIKKEVINDLIKQYGNGVINPDRLFLHIHRVTNSTTNNTEFLWEIKVDSYKGNWFINPNKPDTMYMIKIGFKDNNGHFIEVLKSNTVKTPRDTMSDNLSQHWVYVDIDKPIALQPVLYFKAYLKYQWEMGPSSFVSSIFGSDNFLKKS